MTERCLCCEEELNQNNMSEDKELCKECYCDVVISDEEMEEMDNYIKAQETLLNGDW